MIVVKFRKYSKQFSTNKKKSLKIVKYFFFNFEM